MNVSLDRLMHWDLAAENPARLAEAGVKIAITSHGLRDPGTFLAAVRKAVKRGLKPEAALRALTVTPAELFGRATGWARSKSARRPISWWPADALFEAKTKVLETWVDGDRYEVEASRRPICAALGRRHHQARRSKQETLRSSYRAAGETVGQDTARRQVDAADFRAIQRGSQFVASFKGNRWASTACCS